MGIGKLLGGGGATPPAVSKAPTPVKTNVDPNRGRAQAEAARKRALRAGQVTPENFRIDLNAGAGGNITRSGISV